jgi:hypothetical protein
LETARTIRKEEETRRYLPELTKLAKDQQAFLLYCIRNNPLEAYTPGFIAALKEIEPSLAAPQLDKLRTLTSKIDILIRQAGLQDAFVKSTNILAEPMPQTPEAKPLEPNYQSFA